MASQDNNSVCTIEGITFNIATSHVEKNIIKVFSKREIFFDVFECKVHGEQTLVLEKVDEVDMLPVVNIQFIRDGKIYTCEAILMEGNCEEFIINEDNIFFNRYAPVDIENISSNSSEEQDNIEEEVDTLDSSDSEERDLDIDNLPESNHILYETQKEEFIHRLDEQLNLKLSSLKEDFSAQLEAFIEKATGGSNQLIDERLTGIDTTIDEKFKDLKEDIKRIEDFSKQNITEAIKKKISEIEGFFNVYLENISTVNEQREDSNLTKINNNLLKINTVKESLQKNNGSIDILQNKVKILEDLESKIITLDDIKDKFIDEERVDRESKNIIKFVTEKISELSDNIEIAGKEQEERYNSFVDSINVKDIEECKTIIHDKIDEAQIKQLKESLQDNIEQSLRGDISSLKRYVEMASGGGSVAVQYANGGVMNGDLIVAGSLSAHEYLGIETSFAQEAYLPLSGGNLTGQLSSNNTIIAETIVATNLLSSVQMDIGYELSGFNVAGNISVSGNMNVTENITLSGNLNIDGLVDGRDIAGDGIKIDNLDTDVTYLSSEFSSISTKASQADLDAHTSDTTNPHSVTADQVGLGNVTNESKATMFTNPSFTNTINSSGQLNFGDRASNDTLIKVETDNNDLTLIRAASFGNVVGVDLKYIGSGSDDENIFEIATDGGGSVKIDNSGDVGINTTPIDGIDLAVGSFVSSGNVGVGGSATFDDTVTIEGSTTVGKITLSDNSFVTETSSFTLGETHRGATVLLQNTAPITITVPSQIAGHTTTFIAETINAVTFASGIGLSAFNSFNSANQIAGIFGQAQIIFKTSDTAFLGGNIV